MQDTRYKEIQRFSRVSRERKGQVAFEVVVPDRVSINKLLQCMHGKLTFFMCKVSVRAIACACSIFSLAIMVRLAIPARSFVMRSSKASL